MEAVVGKAYPKALEENDLDPVDSPQMELLPEEEGQPVRVRATVAVRPQIELGTYKGIELEGPSAAVSDTDVENALKELRKDSGTLVPVDRAVALGDVPTIDYEGKIDGVPFDGGKAENQPTEILEERFIPGLRVRNRRHERGRNERYRSAFSRGLFEYGTRGQDGDLHDHGPRKQGLGAARARRRVRETLSRARMRPSRLCATICARASRKTHALGSAGQLSGVLMEKLIAAHEVALPSVMVERETENLANESKGYLERAGLDWTAYLEKQGKTEEEVLSGYRADAEQRVKGSLLVEAIAKAENIVATNADVDAEIAQLSQQYGRPREDILRMLQSNIGALVDGIVRTKTLEFLIDNAKVVEADPAVPAGEAATAETRIPSRSTGNGTATIASPA